MRLLRGFRALGLLATAALLAGLAAPQADAGKPASLAAGEWSRLFNDRDLTGWDTWLGKPNGGKEPIGLNQDPKNVFSVIMEEGLPAIRISGEVFGALTSEEEFENYHLKLQFKWGEKKWPPREKAVRDSGLLYHCVGPHGAAGSFWMQSLEFQIQEHDCGDFWSVAGVLVDVEADRGRRSTDPLIFRKGGQKCVGISSRIARDRDYEKKVGEWNTLELLTVGGTSVHVVNGKVNMVLTNARRKVNDKEVPLTRGKIQLQSEGAEIFFRHVAIRPLRSIPDQYLK
jgi:hypothetical protein